MLHVDGAQKSGSGTIVRFAVGLAALLGEELSLTNIRAKRQNPGLRTQHLKAVQALAEICQGSLSGAAVGSMSLRFKPGSEVHGGTYEWDIGTAGSTTLLAMTLLPVAIFAKNTMRLKISGGLFQDFAPSAYHMQYVLFPVLNRMDVDVSLNIIRPGYVPRGGGIIEIVVEPVKGKLKPISLPQQGKAVKVEGIALSSHLRERKVSERIADTASRILRASGYETGIQVVYDEQALQRGAALALYGKTNTGCIIGADRAGEPRRTSEEIGRYTATSLLEDLATGATVDRHLPDQLIFYAALADGVSRYRIPGITDHVEANLWLVDTMLGAKSEVKDNLVTIHGADYLPPWQR
ncbi:MAG: RNA 3'-terminal phosphate cyclase [Dehalococcoidia bacterium]|nr:RNA 3'-terminal phosphate cyclase [Dehalococcoidia bacterium]